VTEEKYIMKVENGYIKIFNSDWDVQGVPVRERDKSRNQGKENTHDHQR
jgi:hypothetical protein